MCFLAGFKIGDSVRSANVWLERVPEAGGSWLKALDPMVVRFADGAKSWMVEEDRSVREGVWIWISSARYDGARL